MSNQEFSPNNPPTFGQLLTQVAEGVATGCTIFEDGQIGYLIFEEGEDIDPPTEGEVRIPMSADEAQAMLADLMTTAPEELDERGRSGDSNTSSWN